MINALRHIASKASIHLDHYVDVDGDTQYKWSARVKDEVVTTVKTFQSFDDCVRNLIETVTPKLGERDE